MMVQGTHVQIKILSHGHLGRCSGSSTEGHCLPQAVETIRTSARNTSLGINRGSGKSL